MKKLLRAVSLAVALVGASTTSGAFAQTATPAIVGTVSAEDRAQELRLKTFDLVWRTVRDKHFDPTLGGVDWERVRRQYEPRATTAADNAELYRVLQEMLGELRQSHFNIIPPEAITPDDQREVGGGVGLDLRLLDGAAVITRVDPDSSAARAGLGLGVVIERIGDQSVSQMLASVRAPRAELAPPSTDPTAAQTAALNLRLRQTRRLLTALAGEPGTTIKLGLLDATGAQREATLMRERLRGELSARLGAFPPQYTEFETRHLPPSLGSNSTGYLGYIRFNVFTLPVVTKLRQAIVDFRDAEGIIIDLRGNPGGVGGIAMSLAGQLTNRPGSLGTMKMRASEVRFAINAQGGIYPGPVAILVDGMSASTSEIVAAGLQEMGRAIVVGERSLGACLPSYMQKLPTGALFQFAIADFRTPKGVLVEGRGVQPDITVKLDRASLLAGRDPQLEAARSKLTQLRAQ